jgi:OmpA-OmpF porin, OOP family
MRHRTVGLRRGAGIGALVLSLVSPALAAPPEGKPGGALDRLSAAPAGDALFAVPSADVTGALKPAASLLLSYAGAPLALRSTNDRAADVTWVSHQLILHALVSVELFRRVKLEADLPVMLDQRGASGTLGEVSAVAPTSAGTFDLRLGGRVVLLRQGGLVPAAAASLSAWLPTGSPGAFTGSGVVRVEPEVLVGATYARFLWALSLGRRLQPHVAGALLGSQTTGRLALAARFFGVQVGPELHVEVGEGSEVWSHAAAGVSAEALLGARYARGPLTFGLGGGPGLGRAPGTPSFRLFASVGFASELGPAPPPEPRREARDAEAAPPPLAAAKGAEARPKGAAPVEAPILTMAADRDGDTVPDVEDACPTLVGDATPGVMRRGCPKDRDHDGIFDVDDRCPDEPGVASDLAEKNGCPSDRDGDSIVDDKDACPNERGAATNDPKTTGCPAAVRIEGAQIVILQQVNFETGRDEIKPDSFSLLEQVAAVLKEHPEIARVAVDGHTDNAGRAQANLELSRRRSISVVRWLTEHGVDARRLETRGFGARQPLADNTTEAGRANNRRVEFLIRRRSLAGEASWRDGPIEDAASP